MSTATATNSQRQQGPTNPLVSALLTDLYQLTMAYAHWKIGRAEDPSVFELFFRKNPFNGGYTIFCGVDEVLKLVQTFRFSEEEISYLKSTPSLSHCEDAFFDYLATIGEEMAKKTTISAVSEGTIVFPRTPLITIEGPLVIGHLLETTLLNLVNFPSLIATNASRMVIRARRGNKSIPCIEFGLRRAQGPDGAMTASKYSYVGGFVGTSNVRAGFEFGIPIAGTHAHSFVQSFSSLEEAEGLTIRNKTTGADQVLLEAVLQHRAEAIADSGVTVTGTNDSELAAFTAYACAFPDNCLCLIDTYDTLLSGIWNFVFVAKALDDFGYRARGVRLDSGDLVELSNSCRAVFDSVVRAEPSRAEAFQNLGIIASNDINEDVLRDFSERDHSLTAFGIGTNLVTCQAQPALGCVYKLVECNGRARIKLSEEIIKVTLPGKKSIYRLSTAEGTPLVDYMTLADEEEPPTPGEAILCRNPFDQQNRIRVVPAKVLSLRSVVFGGGTDPQRPRSLSETREYVKAQLLEDFAGTGVTDYENPSRYKVMVSPLLYKYLHELWEKNAPIPELR